MKKIVNHVISFILISSGAIASEYLCPDLSEIAEDDYITSDHLHFYPVVANIYKAKYINPHLSCFYHGTGQGDVLYVFEAKLPKDRRNCHFSNQKTEINCGEVTGCELTCN